MGACCTTHAEGVKLKLLRESEGELIKTKNEAEARKQQYILEGEGEAQAIRLKAQVRADALCLLVVVFFVCLDDPLGWSRLCPRHPSL